MKKGAIIGIVAGSVATSMLVLLLFAGTYLSKAKAASSGLRSHNDSAYANYETNSYLSGASSNKGITYSMDMSDSFGYADEEAGYFENDVVTQNTPDITEVNMDPTQGRLLIRTVSITAETTNYASVSADLENKVRECGGYIEYSSMNGTGNNRDLRTGTYTVRVPAEKLDALISAVSGSCTVTSSSEGTSDVTLEYVDTKSRIESLRVEYDQLMELLKQAEDLDTIIILQNRLTDVRYQIESSESRIRVLENQVQFATLNLTLREVLEEKEVEEAHVVTYGERVTDQFKDMWENTVEFFQDLLLWIISIIPGLIFMTVLTVIILIIIFSANKKRRKKLAKARAEKEAAEKKAAEMKEAEQISENKKVSKEENKEEKKED